MELLDLQKAFETAGDKMMHTDDSALVVSGKYVLKIPNKLTYSISVTG